MPAVDPYFAPLPTFESTLELSTDAAAPLKPPEQQGEDSNRVVNVDSGNVGGPDPLPQTTSENSLEPIHYITEVFSRSTGRYKIAPHEAKEEAISQAHHVLVVRQKLSSAILSDEARTTVEIRPAQLQGVFRKIFAEVDSFTLGNVRARFFYWAKKRLEQLAAEITDEMQHELSRQLNVALTFCNSFFEETITRVSASLEDSKVAYEDLWTLFPSGALVSGFDRLGNLCVRKVVDVDYLTLGREYRKYFRITAQYVDHDGDQFGWANTDVEIEAFDGARRFEDLEFLPLHMVENRHEIKDTLLRRAEKQQYLIRENYILQQYTGYGLVQTQTPTGKTVERMHFRGKAVIDRRTTLEKVPDTIAAAIHPIASSSLAMTFDIDLDEPDGKAFDVRSVFQACESSNDEAEMTPDHTSEIIARPLPRSVSIHLRQAGSRQRGSGGARHDPTMNLPEIYKLLLSGLVYGYSLSKAQWATLSVSNFADIDWNESAFDALVMDPDIKSQLNRLVQAQNKRAPAADDYIKGKGQGLVGLLHGSPGLGKTFTAEAIAEMAHLPLMVLSAGSLGAEAQMIERSLRGTLELAARWNAVVLLDEADVYLANRGDNMDIRRNAIVSVFLREVEYFTGILLLTTNLREAVDPAFRSRVHFCYGFPDLDQAARFRIWKEFLSQAERSGSLSVDVRAAGQEQLADLELNGRQIKNIMSMASRLAVTENPSVITAKQILSITRTMQTWDKGQPVLTKRRTTVRSNNSTNKTDSRFAPLTLRKNEWDTVTLLLAIVCFLLSAFAITFSGHWLGMRL